MNKPALELNDGDTSWMITSTALVCFMTFGLGFFYAGQLRLKNTVTTIGYVYIIYAVVALVWYLVGFSLVYSDPAWSKGFIGNLSQSVLVNVGIQPDVVFAPTFPYVLFYLFELQFAAITGTLVFGACVERVRLLPMIIFIVIWTCFVYGPIACWMWNDKGGWLDMWGSLDFAGGCAVEINSGFSSLGVSLVLGKRKGLAGHHPRPSNIPMVLLGVAILWFGWFGFNGGSALAANVVAVDAMVSTNMAGCGGGLVWLLMEYITSKRVTIMGFCAGCISGLVAISPGAGYMHPGAATLIGGVAGVVCFFAIRWQKETCYWDDPLDMVGCHGVGGIWGTIACGLFATTEINPAGGNGLFYGNSKLLFKQLTAIGVTVVWAAGVSALIMWVISKFMDIRVTDEEEALGLDKASHDEEATELVSLIPDRVHGETASHEEKTGLKLGDEQL